MSGDSIHLQRLAKNYPITVQQAGSEKFRQHKGLFIGRGSKEHLILGGIDGANFKGGEELIVRMVLEERVIGFRTTVKGKTDRPEVLYITDYPTNVEAVNLRKLERIRVFLPGDLRAEKAIGDDQNVLMLGVRITNMSSGGCQFNSRSAVGKDTAVSISFFLPGERNSLFLKGEVLNCSKTNSIFSQRLKFPNSSENIHPRSEIETWVSQNIVFSDD